MKRPFTKEESKKLSQSIKNGYEKGRVAWATGRKFTEEHKKKLSEVRIKNNIVGVKHPRWIKDRSKLSEKNNGNEYRNSPAHREWSRNVKNRDGWRCKISNDDCSGRMEAHHILGWKDHPELRYQINNGITLCHYHHPRKREDEIKFSPYFQSLVEIAN